MSGISGHLADKFNRYGQAVMIATSIAAAGYTVADKIVTANRTVTLTVPELQTRVHHLERKTEFLVSGMERLTRTKYVKESDE